MLENRGMSFSGRQHCGLDDTRNLARIVSVMLEDRKDGLSFNDGLDKSLAVSWYQPKKKKVKQEESDVVDTSIKPANAVLVPPPVSQADKPLLTPLQVVASVVSANQKKKKKKKSHSKKLKLSQSSSAPQPIQ